ncbi:hypothetical protein CVD28_08765 [Bacillus sp. M6-12]|uniref:S-layer homology domain-containing protein n=1 Tax=Bacillus sp. M6-12 TaxID=2054166 RepID=UPI000C75D8EA|nr:S-layer homology domain-containing protein [Bacillus sp. M6-12]PLS17784.1 hypothetical protein CVD28_08765 [Bacillus sp. M6-12]
MNRNLRFKRTYSLIMVLALIFSTFTPFISASAQTEGIHFTVKGPENYTYGGAELLLHDLETGEVSKDYMNEIEGAFPDVTINDNQNYKIEMVANFYSSDQAAYSYSFKTMTGAQLKSLEEWAWETDAVQLKPDVPFDVESFEYILNGSKDHNSQFRLYSHKDNPVKIFVNPASTNISVNVKGFEKENTKKQYLLTKKLTTLGDGSFDFNKEIEDAMTLSFTGQTESLKISYVNVNYDGESKNADNVNELVVPKGATNLYLTTEKTVDGAIKNSHWSINAPISESKTYPVPDKLNTVKIENTYFSNNAVDVQAAAFSGDFRYSANGDSLTGKVEVINSETDEVIAQTSSENWTSVRLEIPEYYPSGEYKVKYTLSHTENNEVIGTAEKSLSLQNQESSEIKGLVITAEDLSGQPLKDAKVYVYERTNQDSWEANYTDEFTYYLNQIYSTTILEKNGRTEAFIPNAYLLKGREYEIVVASLADNKIVYHKTINGTEVNTLNLKKDDLSKITVSTEKNFTRATYSVDVVDNNRAYMSFPIFLETPKQAVTAYVSTEANILFNAKMYETDSDTGYALSKLITAEDNKEIKIDLDAQETVTITPPAGEKSKVDVNPSWTTRVYASKYIVSKDYISNLTGAEYSPIDFYVEKEGYRFDFTSSLNNESFSKDTVLTVGNEFSLKGYQLFPENNKIHFNRMRFLDSNNNHLVKVSNISSGGETVAGSNPAFLALNQEAVKNYQVTNSNEYSVADAQTGTSMPEAGLLTYQVYKDDNPVGDVIKANSIETVSVPKPSDEGNYTLRLVDQAFSKDFIRLNVNNHIPNIKDNDTETFKLKVNPKIGDLTLSESGWLQPRLYKKVEIEENQFFYQQYYLGKTGELEYETYNPLNIEPNDEWVVVLTGSFASGTNQRGQFVDYQKLTGDELLKLQEYTITQDLKKLDVKNDTELYDQYAVGLKLGSNNWVTNYVSINSYNPLYVKDGDYRVILTGVNDSVGYYFNKDVTVKENQEITFSDNDPLKEVSIERAGKTVPFKDFVVRTADGDSTYGGGYSYGWTTQVLNKIMVSPGTYELLFEVIEIPKNETPWSYGYRTVQKEFNETTKLQLGSEFTKKAIENFAVQNYYNDGYSVTGDVILQSGDLILDQMGVYRESNSSKNVLGDENIREYDGQFNYDYSIPSTITVTDQQGKIAYKADDHNFTDLDFRANLVKGAEYTLNFKMAIAPGKEVVLTQDFKVVDKDEKFVRLNQPQQNEPSKEKTFEVIGETNPSSNVTIQIFAGDAQSPVQSQTVTADANGHFAKEFTLADDGTYTIKAVHAEDAEAVSNELTYNLDTTPPAVPQNVTAEQTKDGVKVTWNAVNDAAEYHVYVAEGDGSFTKVDKKITENSYLLTAIKPGTSYKFKIAAADKTGNVSKESETTSVTTSDFAATKLDVALNTNASYNLVKIGSEAKIALEGSYEDGFKASATISYKKGTEAKEESVALTYNQDSKKYEGSFKVVEGITEVTKADATIVKADGTTKTNTLTKNLNNAKVGATLKGKVTQGDADLTSKAKIRLAAGSTIFSFDTNADGSYTYEGAPAGSYSLQVTANGKTYKDAVTEQVKLEGGKTSEQNVNLPISKEAKIQFVEKGTTSPVQMDLSVKIEKANQEEIVYYGYINKETGYFNSWGGNEQLTNLSDGDYKVTVYASGIYKQTESTFKVTAASDFVTNPVKVEVDTLTDDKRDVVISFTNENLTSVDSISLYSWDTYEAFDYNAGYYYEYNPEIHEGKITIKDVVYSDSYELYIYKEGYRSFTKTPIKVDAESGNIEVTLDEGKTVTGTVKAGSDKVAGAQVSAYSNSSYAYAVTDTEGKFTLKGLASDEDFTVDVSSPAYMSKQETFTKDKTEVEITLVKASSLDGYVKDKDAKPLKHVYVYAYEVKENNEFGNYKGFARTDAEGYFKIFGLEEDKKYGLKFYSYDYPTTEVIVEKNSDTYTLQQKSNGSFTGEGNRLTASAATIIPEKTLKYRLDYQNNGETAAENLLLDVTLPAGLTLEKKTILLNGTALASADIKDTDKGFTVTVPKVEKDAKGSLSFEAVVGSNAGNTIYTTAKINGDKVEDAPVLSATTNVLFVNINAPEKTAAKKIKVYGNAKQGSSVEVYANGALLANVKVDGRWWFADVTLPVKDAKESEDFNLVAKAKEGEVIVTSETLKVSYQPDLPKVESVTVYAGWNGNVSLNPYTGVASFAIVEKTPLDSTVKFAEEVDSASITFLGKTYSMEKGQDGKTFTFDGQKLGEWSSYGEQLLELTFKKGDITITLPLMEIIVLIDPSGFVFEGSMENKLEGVTATVEENKGTTAAPNWQKWNAEFFGQINPQVTDVNGRYGWDVIQGEWRVVFAKNGYNTYVSRTVTVPPPETQLNVPMVRTSNPTVKAVSPASQGVDIPAKVTVEFDRLMDIKEIEKYINVYKVPAQGEKIKVTGAVSIEKEYKGYKQVDGQPGYYEEDASKKLAKQIFFTPAAAFEAGTTYQIEVLGTIKDYDQKELGDTASHSFTTKAAATNPGGGSPGGGGGGISLPAPQVPTQPVPGNPDGKGDGTVTVGKDDIQVNNGRATLEEKIVETIQGQKDFTKLTVKANDQQVTDVSIPGSIISAAKSKNAKAVIEIEAEAGSYSLPVAEIALSELAAKLGTEAKNVNLVITLKEAAADLTSINKAGLKAVSKVIDFNVEAQYGGKSEHVNRFADYVDRSINIGKTVNPDKAIVVKLTEKGFVPVPTVFKGDTAVIKSLTNSLYVVVESDKTFKDVNNGANWAEKYIETLAAKLIVSGASSTEYAPARDMTRGEFAALISRSLGLAASKPNAGQFTDVSTKLAVNKNGEITAAYEAGIIKGKTDKRFAPNEKITRAEAAVMISRAMDYVGYDKKKLDTTKKVSQFKDGKNVRDWSKEGVETVVQAGIMNGMAGGSFKPSETTKRDQMAKIVADFLKFVEMMN